MRLEMIGVTGIVVLRIHCRVQEPPYSKEAFPLREMKNSRRRVAFTMLCYAVQMELKRSAGDSLLIHSSHAFSR